MYEMIDQHKIFEPTLLDGLDNLKVLQCVIALLDFMMIVYLQAFLERFEVSNTLSVLRKLDCGEREL